VWSFKPGIFSTTKHWPGSEDLVIAAISKQDARSKTVYHASFHDFSVRFADKKFRSIYYTKFAPSASKTLCLLVLQLGSTSSFNLYFQDPSPTRFKSYRKPANWTFQDILVNLLYVTMASKVIALSFFYTVDQLASLSRSTLTILTVCRFLISVEYPFVPEVDRTYGLAPSIFVRSNQNRRCTSRYCSKCLGASRSYVVLISSIKLALF